MANTALSERHRVRGGGSEGKGGVGAQRYLTANYTLAPQHKQIPYTQPSDVYSFIGTILVKLG